MIKTYSSTRPAYIYSPLQAFYRVECKTAPPRNAPEIQDTTGRARSSHYAKSEFLMGHYSLRLSSSGLVSANRWTSLSGHSLHRQNVSTDSPVYILSAKWKHNTHTKKPPQGIKAHCRHIRARSWPLMSLWSCCETDGTFQKPSIHFRVRPELISAALKGVADIID